MIQNGVGKKKRKYLHSQNSNFKSKFHIKTGMKNVFVGRCSSVGIATGYGLVGLGIDSRWGGEIFRTCPDRPWAHPASCTMGDEFFLGVKAAGA